MSPPATSLLLVDDEPQIIRALTPALEAENYQVEIADTGEAALSRMARDPCDLVLLDLGLPDMDGKMVIERMRQWSDAPIVVLSAREKEAEKVAALDAGADDYVSKPANIDELMARLRANLRGREMRYASSTVRVGDLELDIFHRRVLIQGEEMRLTQREFDLLRTLARHPGRVVTHRQIIAAVWSSATLADGQSVRVLVSQLRQKIEEEPSRPRLLLSEPGVGYRLRAE